MFYKKGLKIIKRRIPMKSANAKRTVACLFLLSAFLLLDPAPSFSFEIAIEVAPNTLNIPSESQVVTVHTNISYSSVDHDNVYLNGILISSWKADNRGNFVAKFLMEEVKALADSGAIVVPGENELTLIGYTTEGTEFTGTQSITVINVEPAGSGRK
jgi:hypothetical protein